MKRKYRGVQLLVLLVGLCAASAAMAHKIRVFAYQSGAEILGEAKFGSGRPVKGADTLIASGTNEILLQLTTDDNGEFRFPITPELEELAPTLVISVDAGEGHRGSWTIKPSEYLATESTPGESPTMDSHPPPVPLPSPKNPDMQPDGGTSLAAIEHIVEKTIAREVAPLKKIMVEQQQKGVNLRDILGGLGYIIGLAGIAAYIKSKKKER